MAGCSALSSDVRSQKALELATAASLQVPWQDVHYSHCSDLSTRLLTDSKGPASLQTVSASLAVSVPLSQFLEYDGPLGNSTALYESLQRNIIAAVSSGNCTRELVEASHSLNASATSAAAILTTSATPPTVEYPPSAAPVKTPSPSSGSNGGSNGISKGISAYWVGVIVGSVLGGVAFLLILIFIAIRFSKPKGDAYQATVNSVEEPEMIEVSDLALYPSNSEEVM